MIHEKNTIDMPYTCDTERSIVVVRLREQATAPTRLARQFSLDAAAELHATATSSLRAAAKRHATEFERRR